jgi:hypothetical protein
MQVCVKKDIPQEILTPAGCMNDRKPVIRPVTRASLAVEMVRSMLASGHTALNPSVRTED